MHFRMMIFPLWLAATPRPGLSRWCIGPAVLSVVLACSDSPVRAVPENLDWQDLGRMPVARSGFGAASFNGHIYVVGGWNDGYQATRTVHRYNVEMAAWEQLSDFPIEVADLELIVSRDSLFVVGGIRATTGLPIRMLRVYDPLADDWLIRPHIPDARSGHATTELDGTIYLLGGPMTEASSHGPRVPGDSVLAYDVFTASWSYREPMTVPRYGVVAVRDSDRFHTIGGLLLSTGVPYDELDTYDPATDSWESLTRDPYATLQPVAAVLDGQIHLIGGGTGVPGSAGSATHRTYSLDDDTWEYVNEMWLPVVAARGVTHRGELYLLGGRLHQQMLERFLVFRPQ